MAKVPKKILFYNEREEPFGVFSNFSPHPVNLNGKRWPTTEHYFQVIFVNLSS